MQVIYDIWHKNKNGAGQCLTGSVFQKPLFPLAYSITLSYKTQIGGLSLLVANPAPIPLIPVDFLKRELG